MKPIEVVQLGGDKLPDKYAIHERVNWSYTLEKRKTYDILFLGRTLSEDEITLLRDRRAHV